MNLSDHFSLEEATRSDTATRLGISNQPNAQQLENMKVAAIGMEKIRELLASPINVNSWIRLPEVNVAVKGSKVSSHMDGWAIDFTCKGFGTPLEVCKAIEKSNIKFDQMIYEFGEKGWTHLSFAPEMRQQKLTIFRPQNKYAIGILTQEEYNKAV
jgi:zinc D-Ala-D-Ala carboxypeptidase